MSAGSIRSGRMSATTREDEPPSRDDPRATKERTRGIVSAQRARSEREGRQRRNVTRDRTHLALELLLLPSVVLLRGGVRAEAIRLRHVRRGLGRGLNHVVVRDVLEVTPLTMLQAELLQRVLVFHRHALLASARLDVVELDPLPLGERVGRHVEIRHLEASDLFFHAPGVQQPSVGRLFRYRSARVGARNSLCAMRRFQRASTADARGQCATGGAPHLRRDPSRLFPPRR